MSPAEVLALDRTRGSFDRLGISGFSHTPGHFPKGNVSSEWAVIRAQSRKTPSIGCERGHFHVQPTFQAVAVQAFE
jgi:hypothetical protein